MKNPFYQFYLDFKRYAKKLKEDNYIKYTTDCCDSYIVCKRKNF